MNEQFIQGVIFDWKKIDNDSYLKRIEAFKGVEKLDFDKPITFFVGENGSGKSTLLEALAVAHGFNPEGGTKNYVFLRMIHIYSCTKEGTQFIMVTHSPILLGIPDVEIYCFDNGRIHLCEYEDTESYRVTEMFINNRQMLLDRLLRE